MINVGLLCTRLRYTLLAVALAISLMIVAAPAVTAVASDCDEEPAEWHKVGTPTMEGFVIAPGSTIIDYALASDGEVAYAAVDAYDDGLEDCAYCLLKSTDHAATWTDITPALENLLDLDDGDYIDGIIQVATDWQDGDFVAVALWAYLATPAEYQLHVFFSTDGGDTFVGAGEVEDDGIYFDDPYDVADLAVSLPYADGKRDIAIGGTDWDGYAALFRCVITADSPGAWQDATTIGGWDDAGLPSAFDSMWVTDIIFSPSWASERTILVTTIENTGDLGTWGTALYNVHLQSGSWGTDTQGWNADSTLGIDAVEILLDVELPTWFAVFDAGAIAGITLPSDYNSSYLAQRKLWVSVNYYDDSTGDSANEILRVSNDTPGPIAPPGRIGEGRLWLTNISYQGTIDSGKAIAGLLGTGSHNIHDDEWKLFTDCGPGVQVYRNDAISYLDICCERWRPACKVPTGMAAMAVSYVAGSKAYAVALYGMDYDESAWSWTFDDGDNWNQLSLIDTYIDYMSDVAVSPDCNKTMLVSVHQDAWDYDVYVPDLDSPPWAPWECVILYPIEGEQDYYDVLYLNTDSVWLHAVDLPEAPEYSGQWIRTWSGLLTGEDYWGYEHGILRLSPDETGGHTVYLADLGTRKVYRETMEGLGCWVEGTAPNGFKIVDLAVKDATTIYALGYDGKVTEGIGDEFAITFSTAVASGLESGWTIAAWGDELLVGNRDGDVAHSSHGTSNFTDVEGGLPEGMVTVAFDSYYGSNGAIYAALYEESDYLGDIYLWVMGESTSWINLGARPSTFQLTGAGSTTDSHQVAYTGIVLDSADGNPKSSAATGGVLYASYVAEHEGSLYTGVARSLTPLMEVDDCALCPVEWDYLRVGLTPDYEGFEAMPHALKMCGCLTSDSCTRLFAIDWWEYYDMEDVTYGAVWRFDDCYSKKCLYITSPSDGATIPADPTEHVNLTFGLAWSRECDALRYDIQIALDESFTQVVFEELGYLPPVTATPNYLVGEGQLSSGVTYHWRVRAVQASTTQAIRSWWSDSCSFMVDVSGWCFIATAAYGTPMAEEIQILREFRDGYLLTNFPGRAFVDFYYRTSPPIAQFITDHPGLKPTVRAVLVPAVAMSTVVVNTTPAQKAAAASMVVLISVVLVVWATKRRRMGPQNT